MRAILRRLPAAVLAATLLTACGDDALGPDAVDPAAMESSMDDMASSFTGNAAFQSLAQLAFFFPSYPSVSLVRATLPITPRADRSALIDAFRRRTAETPVVRSAGPEATPFPVDVLGKTFVWNTSSDQYEIDPAVSGAPANGIRIRLYTVNSSTGQPVEPLQLLGYVELTDESSASAQRLGVLLKLGATTIADYTISSITATTSSTFTAVGYIVGGDGTGRVDFNLTSTSFENGNEELLYLLTAANGGSLRIEIDDTATSSTLLIRVTNGGNTIELSGTGNETGASGSLKYNGTVVATFTQSGESDPVFTGANGHTLTTAERLQIISIFETALTIAFEFVFAIILPAFVLFAVGGSPPS